MHLLRLFAPFMLTLLLWNWQAFLKMSLDNYI